MVTKSPPASSKSTFSPRPSSEEISGRHAPAESSQVAPPLGLNVQNAEGGKTVLDAELVDPRVESRLHRIHLIARLMDDAISIPGTNYRLGWDSVIGIVPGIGDAASAGISAWLVYEAKQLGLPKRKLLQMVANIIIDALVGVIPVLGDFFDVAFKANRKNARIVRNHFKRTSDMV